jgi:ABC-type transport system involved in multi-copper enzyme maturation permease subunit
VMHLVANELRRLTVRRLFWVLTGLPVLGMLTAGVVKFVQADPEFLVTSLDHVVRGATVALVVLAFVVGASFVGADWRAGTVMTQLTWEPRRVRIFVGKCAAVILAAGLASVVLQTLLAGVLLPGALRGGGSAGAGAAWLRSMVGEVLRGAALSAIGAAIGLALGSIGRNTALALGAGFIYLAVLEGGLLSSLFPGINRWLMVPNAIQFVVGGDYLVGRSVTAAGVLLAAYAVGALAIAVAVFQSRDVT